MRPICGALTILTIALNLCDGRIISGSPPIHISQKTHENLFDDNGIKNYLLQVIPFKVLDNYDILNAPNDDDPTLEIVTITKRDLLAAGDESDVSDGDNERDNAIEDLFEVAESSHIFRPLFRYRVRKAALKAKQTK